MRARSFPAGSLLPTTAAFCALAGIGLLLCGCGSGGTGPGRVARMGEKVQVGPLIYNILESEWRSQIGDPPEVRYPKHRFLVLRITVTNSGAAESGIPHLLLEDAKGHSYPEGVEGQAIPEWMGVLRRVKPADTEQGRIYFDVPTGAYRLRVTDDADRGQEKIVVVDIPLRLDAEVPGSTPTLSIPSEPHTK